MIGPISEYDAYKLASPDEEQREPRDDGDSADEAYERNE